MTYINPRIYNFSNLKPEDQLTITMMMDLVGDLENLEYDYEPGREASTLEKIEGEIAVNTIREAQDYLESSIVDWMVSIIDNYEDEYEIEDKDTDDYFYGLEQHG